MQTLYHKTLNLRCKLRQIVNPQRLLDVRHTVDHLFESIVSEQLVLLLLEILAERVVFVAADDLVKRGEEHGILAGFVGAVHAEKRGHRVAELAALVAVAKGFEIRVAKRYVGELSAA